MNTFDAYLATLGQLNDKIGAEPHVGWDLPENDKIKYAWLRNEQMYNVRWSPLTTIDGGDRTVTGGTIYKGLPYSSVKHHDKFIGHNISWETFFTALKNPASVLYTKTCYNTPPHTNATLWYGIVCSNFTCNSLGIFDVRPVTRLMKTMDGVTVISNPLDIKIMDFLITPDGRTGHTEVITGIYRNRTTGGILKVEITDAWPIVVRRTVYTWLDFLTHLTNEGMSICRYNITNETYESSPFVQIPGEPNPKAPYVYNTVLMTDFGNKANYRKTVEPTEINIMDSNAQTLVIKRDGTIVANVAVSSITPTTINGIEYTIYTYPNTSEGNYEAYCVMNNGMQSDKVEWIVYSCTASLASSTVVNGANITVNFSGVNCTPISLNGNYYTTDKTSWSSVRWLKRLTSQEITAGEAITNYLDTDNENEFGIKVYFQTPFGIVPTDAVVVNYV